MIWTPTQLAYLRRHFSTRTTADLASAMHRTPSAISHQAAALGLHKDAAHKSKQARKVATAAADPSHMAAIGALGGEKGGKARAKRLTPAQRKTIAQNAIAARWAKKKRKPITG